MKKSILIAVLILGLVVIGWLAELLWSAGQFKTIAPHFDGTCSAISGIVGAEDITIHPQTGIAFISACDRRAIAAGKPGRGGIYAYDLNAAAPGLLNLTPGAGEDFRPHGISLYVDEAGRASLFVINHANAKHQIEIFDLRGGKLLHRKTLSDPLIVSPNDLVAVGPDKVYVSNDHRYVAGLMRLFEDYLRLKWSNVVFYDGTGFAFAASGFAYANGLNISPDGKTLYLCATTERALHIFDRDPVSGKLSHRRKMKLNTGVDNIEVDRAGGLWIGAHPKLLSFIAHSQDPNKLSPSQILHLVPTADGGYDVEEVYLNSGDEISASSVAAVIDDRMLIGAVFDPKFLDCRK